MNVMHCAWTQVGTEEEVATPIPKTGHAARQMGSGTLTGEFWRNRWKNSQVGMLSKSNVVQRLPS